jgi:hypothetical protein
MQTFGLLNLYKVEGRSLLVSAAYYLTFADLKSAGVDGRRACLAGDDAKRHVERAVRGLARGRSRCRCRSNLPHRQLARHSRRGSLNHHGFCAFPPHPAA